MTDGRWRRLRGVVIQGKDQSSYPVRRAHNPRKSGRSLPVRVRAARCWWVGTRISRGRMRVHRSVSRSSLPRWRARLIFGNVVVRSGLFVDPGTAQVTVKSDPIPTILQGIPIDLRSIAIMIDRPQFTLNPTCCEPLSVTGQGFDAGPAVGLSEPLPGRWLSGIVVQTGVGVARRAGRAERTVRA